MGGMFGDAEGSTLVRRVIAVRMCGSIVDGFLNQSINILCGAVYFSDSATVRGWG